MMKRDLPTIFLNAKAWQDHISSLALHIGIRSSGNMAMRAGDVVTEEEFTHEMQDLTFRVEENLLRF